MPGDYQLDRRFTDGFNDLEIFLARNSEDSINSLVLKGGDEEIRTFDRLQLVRVHSECSCGWGE